MLQKPYKFLLITSLLFTILVIEAYLVNSLSMGRVGDVGSQKMSVELKSAPNDSSINDGEVEIIATGDVMLGRSVYLESVENNDINYPFRNTSVLLRSSDISLINLENPLVENCPEHNSGFKFCSPPETVDALTFAGVDVANIANNHIGNYGKSGYLNTINVLERNDIKVSDEDHFAVLNIKGMDFGFLGFNETFKTLKVDEVGEIIASNSANVDVMIVSFHWGEECKFEPNNAQRRLGRLAVDNGADLVIGHHPHVVQSIEVYDDVPIVHSLGNFVFDQMWSEETKEGVVARFIFNRDKLEDYEFIPVKTYELGQPSVVEDMELKEKTLNRL